MSNLPYRPNVCLLILNDQGKLFLGERFGEPNVWQFPQGGVEGDDTLEASALREASEELGVPIDRFKIIKQLKGNHRYDFSSPRLYGQVMWRGQTQTFWLLQFVGDEREITLSGPEREFESFQWCTVTEVRLQAEQKRRLGYEVVLPEVEEYLQVNK